MRACKTYAKNRQHSHIAAVGTREKHNRVHFFTADISCLFVFTLKLLLNARRENK